MDNKGVEYMIKHLINLLFVTTCFAVGNGPYPSGGGSTYTLPPATTTTLGGVIPDGTTIAVDGSGHISTASLTGINTNIIFTTGNGASFNNKYFTNNGSGVYVTGNNFLSISVSGTVQDFSNTYFTNVTGSAVGHNWKVTSQTAQGTILNTYYLGMPLDSAYTSDTTSSSQVASIVKQVNLNSGVVTNNFPAATLYVDPNGIDVAYRQTNSPYATVPMAVSNSISGDEIYVRAGIYNIGTNQINLKANTVLKSVKGSSLIVSTYTNSVFSTVYATIHPADNCVIDGITLAVSCSSFNSAYNFPFGSGQGDLGFTNVVIRDSGCVTNDSDTFVLFSSSICTWTLERPFGVSSWDTFNQNGNSGDSSVLFLPYFYTTNVSSFGSAATKHGIFVQSGSVSVTGGSISYNDIGNSGIGYGFDSSAGTLSISGTIINGSTCTNNGVSADIFNSVTGNLNIIGANITRSDGKPLLIHGAGGSGIGGMIGADILVGSGDSTNNSVYTVHRGTVIAPSGTGLNFPGNTNVAIAIASNNVVLIQSGGVNLLQGSYSGNGHNITGLQSVAGITNANFLAKSAAQTIAIITTPAGVTNSYEVGGYLDVTAVTVDVAALQAVFTDENGTSRTVTPLSGVAATGFSASPTVTIQCAPSTTITLQAALTTGTGSITYDTGGFIRGIY